MTNKEKFKRLVSTKPNHTLARARERQANRAWKKESQKIALMILTELDKPDWSQKRLAEEMGVSAQYVNKLVKGNENMGLKMQVQLQSILGISILASAVEKKEERNWKTTKEYNYKGEVNSDDLNFRTQSNTFSNSTTAAKVVKLNFDKNTTLSYTNKKAL